MIGSFPILKLGIGRAVCCESFPSCICSESRLQLRLRNGRANESSPKLNLLREGNRAYEDIKNMWEDSFWNSFCIEESSKNIKCPCECKIKDVKLWQQLCSLILVGM